ncbi:hypothetical protein ACTWP4_07650 [Gracilibacillus sp. D59]|uniref:hypothetical protein n=1 Tax=Gracilibacillus sp. D59 TaxID=3457434 RepID=UPI003FCE33F8
MITSNSYWVAYESDVELVRYLLLQVAEDERMASGNILTDPEPFVNFVGFGESSLDFELFIWIPKSTLVIKTTSNINFRIDKILNDNHIEIPFPRRDLHIKSVAGKDKIEL